MELTHTTLIRSLPSLDNPTMGISSSLQHPRLMNTPLRCHPNTMFEHPWCRGVVPVLISFCKKGLWMAVPCTGVIQGIIDSLSTPLLVISLFVCLSPIGVCFSGESILSHSLLKSRLSPYKRYLFIL